MTLFSPRPRADEIADAIRKRICLQPLDEQAMLLEGTLAAEFGVSRTPVRQALQRLAYEGLIEVRTGVGSISNPIDLTARRMHFAVHCGLLRLVAALPDAPLPLEVKGRLAGLAQHIRQGQPVAKTEAFDLFAELNSTLSRLIPDTVIADAHLVSGWRVVRWSLADMRPEAGKPIESLARLCIAAQEKADTGRAALFHLAADLFDIETATPS